MFDTLKKLFFEKRGAADLDIAFTGNDTQIAEAALMFHVIAADGIVTDEERATLSARVSDQFGLSPRQTTQLIEAARQADAEAIDLYSFTRTLKRELDYDARLGLIENLWQMVFADGVVHELEDNIVWRVAELLDVSSRDRMELKRRVRGKSDEGDE